jgi:hypothetical protein
VSIQPAYRIASWRPAIVGLRVVSAPVGLRSITAKDADLLGYRKCWLRNPSDDVAASITRKNRNPGGQTPRFPMKSTGILRNFH